MLQVYNDSFCMTNPSICYMQNPHCENSNGMSMCAQKGNEKNRLKSDINLVN